MKKDDRVVLTTFHGQKCSDENLRADEDFYKLIGKCGTVIDFCTRENQALVLFDDSLDDMGLANHNEIKNTLWINETDLEIIER